MNDDRKLVMSYGGGLVKHLGLQMYSGAVPAIAELIANAWDADAGNVWIDIPLGTKMRSDLEITVRDDGHGMKFEDVNDRYLYVGRNRRREEGNYTPEGREVMGRKGIGKLAGFGIANLVEVWTVKDGWLTAFQMDYEKLLSEESEEFVRNYEPPLLHDRKAKSSDPVDTEEGGTLVKLKRLQLQRAINEENFRESMARRFAVLSDKFKVFINDTRLARTEMVHQFRFPEEGVNQETIPGFGKVSWWIGFTPKPIKREESRGLVVLVRGKLAQAPFFFDASGGTAGQMGMQYLTGEVEGDGLDSEVDLIATDRASVRWEDPRAQALLQWGQQLVRRHLREWSKKRRDERLKKLKRETPYWDQIEKFPRRERGELKKAIEKLATIDTIEDERLSELVDVLIKAYENEYFMEVIRALNAADEGAQEEMFKLVAEWDVLEAVATAQIVRGRVEVIRKFRALIETEAREKPEMQDFLKDHPWLIDPQWQVLQHERSLDKVLAHEFQVDGGNGTGRRRLDFFCLGDSLRAVVVEVKRPGVDAGRDELRQIEDYVDYLRQKERNTDPAKQRHVNGCLIASDLAPEAAELVQRLEGDGIRVRTWRKLLQTAENLHREFLALVKSRAPKDDPRIESLDELGEEQAGVS